LATSLGKLARWILTSDNLVSLADLTTAAIFLAFLSFCLLFLALTGVALGVDVLLKYLLEPLFFFLALGVAFFAGLLLPPLLFEPLLELPLELPIT
jgi:hypothetical protein